MSHTDSRYLSKEQRAELWQSHPLCDHADYMDESVERLEAQNRGLVEAIDRTLEENRHLADGENCTLIHLKRAIARATGPAEELNCKRCGAHVASACTCAGPAEKEPEGAKQ